MESARASRNTNRSRRMKDNTIEEHFSESSVRIRLVIAAGKARAPPRRNARRGQTGVQRRRPGEYRCPPNWRHTARCRSCWGASATDRSRSSALAKRPWRAISSTAHQRATTPARQGLPLPAAEPIEAFRQPQPDAEYFYRLQWPKAAAATFAARPGMPFSHPAPGGQHVYVAVQGIPTRSGPR